MGRSRHFLDIDLANGYANGYSYVAPATRPPAVQNTASLRVTLREDSTRVQLQKQRVKEQHAAVLVGKNIPGFKTSAAFFGSLRTNLRLHASPPPSPVSTPPSMRGSATSLPPPSPLSHAVDSVMGDDDHNIDPPPPPPAEDPLAGVPELKTYLTDDDDDKVAAMKLVADSIAQMRQTANHRLITHPLNMAVVVALVALAARYMLESKRDKYVAATTGAGIVMIFLAGVRMLTKDYLFAAEAVNWDWLGNADVIVTKFGEEVIGAVVIGWLSGESRQKRKKAWRGEIKAWTVRLKYRKKGVGAALLEEAVKEARKKGAEALEFSDQHANSKRVLPGLYNGPFDERDRKGRELLDDLLQTSPVRGKKRRGSRD